MWQWNGLHLWLTLYCRSTAQNIVLILNTNNIKSIKWLCNQGRVDSRTHLLTHLTQWPTSQRFLLKVMKKLIYIKQCSLFLHSRQDTPIHRLIENEISEHHGHMLQNSLMCISLFVVYTVAMFSFEGDKFCYLKCKFFLLFLIYTVTVLVVMPQLPLYIRSS